MQRLEELALQADTWFAVILAGVHGHSEQYNALRVALRRDEAELEPAEAARQRKETRANLDAGSARRGRGG